MTPEDYKPQFKLHKGDKAPAIVAPLQDGSLFNLYLIKSEWIVLFFYPEDDTPTCTKEACNLRDHYEDLTSNDIALYGISPDSEAKHRKFISKFSLPYNLIVDKDHKIANEYGVWGKKKLFGLIYNGIHRTSFIINKDYRIHDIIYPVVSATHHKQILDSIG